MLDVALIKECADPSLKPLIVEQFVETVGSLDPLAITVKSGGRLVLVPKAANPSGAMEIIRQHVGHAIVRVGLTQYPAGIGLKDASELKPDIVEPCANLRIGTAMFAKILRIVANWYGNPKSEEVFPQIFEDAVHAWKTGMFEGEDVFRADDPGGEQSESPKSVAESDRSAVSEEPIEPDFTSRSNVHNADIRIDLSRIGDQQ